ncbi:MAG: LytR/AlgR family response regulator transcription factor [Bacteroidia bacterium]
MIALSFLIVEDELLIAETISEILLELGYQDTRMVSTVDEAITEIEARKPGMVLTDINLESDKSGIDLGRILNKQYQIPFIYITSHSSKDIVAQAKYTLPNAYIVKPFKKEDIAVAIELAAFNTNNIAKPGSSELIVREGRAIIKLNCDDITWLETDGNYVTINLSDGKRRVVRIAMSELQQQLPATQFIRVHKSYLVNKKQVTEIHTNIILVGSNELPIGRTYQQTVGNLLK